MRPSPDDLLRELRPHESSTTGDALPPVDELVDAVRSRRSGAADVGNGPAFRSAILAPSRQPHRRYLWPVMAVALAGATALCVLATIDQNPPSAQQQAYWRVADSSPAPFILSPTPHEMVSDTRPLIACPSRGHCYMITSSTAFRTTDDGESWHISPLTGLRVATSLTCPLVSTCFVSGQGVRSGTSDRTVLLRTNDGGTTWTKPNPIPPSISSLRCPTATDCFAVGILEEKENTGEQAVSGSEVLSTTDGGADWRTRAVFDDSLVTDLQCFSTSSCDAISMPLGPGSRSGSFLMTDDAAAHWEDTPLPSSVRSLDLNDMFSCADAMHCGLLGQIMGRQVVADLTNDAGHHWRQSTLHGFSDLSGAIQCPIVDRCFVGFDNVGPSISLEETDDGGHSWSVAHLPPAPKIDGEGGHPSWGALAGLSCSPEASCVIVALDVAPPKVRIAGAPFLERDYLLTNTPSDSVAASVGPPATPPSSALSPPAASPVVAPPTRSTPVAPTTETTLGAAATTPATRPPDCLSQQSVYTVTSNQQNGSTICLAPGSVATIVFDMGGGMFGGTPGSWIPSSVRSDAAVLRIDSSSIDGNELSVEVTAAAPGGTFVTASYTEQCGGEQTTPCTVPPQLSMEIWVTVGAN